MTSTFVRKTLLLLLSTGLFMATMAQAQIFTEKAGQYGVSASYGDSARFGGGVSLYDFNGDGLDDLTLASGEADPLRFFENQGGSFTEVFFTGLQNTTETKQVIWADYDNDADPDLFVSSNKNSNYLYVNDGSFQFSQMVFPKSAQVADTAVTSYGATFTDLDRDGYLDLFISHYAIQGNPASAQLFMNNGDGTFTDVTSAFFFQGDFMPTFVVIATDCNNDMEPDIYTAEDREKGNRMFENLGGGFLSDISASSGADVAVNGMGLAAGDYDGDGDLDYYISNTPEGNPLMRNNGNGTFTRVDSLLGVSFNRVGWGVTFLDYDNDGDNDLYVCGSTDVDAVLNQVYENTGGGTFSALVASAMPGDSTMSFSPALGDLNNDGAVDIAVNCLGPDSLMLWENTNTSNNYVKVRLEGTVSNKDGYGAWIKVYQGATAQVHFTMCATSFMGQDSRDRIFGLGSGNVDSVLVYWPSGIVDKVIQPASNSTLDILEGDFSTGTVDALSPRLSVSPNPFSEVLRIDPQGLTGEWELVDLKGRILFVGRIDGLGQEELILPGLAPGTYLFRFNHEGRILIRKVVKQ